MGIYKPPNREGRLLHKFNNEFIDFSEILSNYCHQSRTKLLIADDFNINSIALSRNQITADIENNARSVGLFPTNFLPTRITNKSTTLINNC